MAHIKFDGYDNVSEEGPKIKAQVDNININWIHLRASSVVIQYAIIRTRDNCVSIEGGSLNISIKRLKCGPRHGINVGSLGKSDGFDDVRNTTINGTMFKGTQNVYKNYKKNQSY